MGVRLVTLLVILLIIFSGYAYAKNETKVIIKFKDPSSLKKLNMADEDIKLEIKKTQIADYRDNILKKLDLDIEYGFNYTNTVVAYVNQTELKELKKSKYIEGVYEDYPIGIFLDATASMIGADDFWSIDIKDVPVNGSSETVCIIDTGIDYTHAAFGSCEILNETSRGDIIAYENESMHPYHNDLNKIYMVNYTGFERISVHFVNISLESEWDYVKILDAENNTVALYTGFMEDFWTPSVEGDKLYIKLETDESVTDWGFKLDKIINGSVNTTLNWSTCKKVIGGWDLTGQQNNLDDQDPKDDEGHGTHISGIVSSLDATYKGIAPGSRIVSVKALNSDGSGNTTDVMAAIEYCIENRQRYNISVISLSLGSGSYPGNCDQNSGLFALFSSLVNDAITSGIMVVAASGNSGYSNGIAFPACLENVTSVGAVNKGDSIDISYSNSNAYLDLLAPGTQIYSAQKGGGFVQSTGTSMSAPYVSGAALLLRNFKRQENGTILSPKQIQDILKASGNNRTDPRNSFKTERINLTNAISIIDSQPRLAFTSSLEGNTSQNTTFLNLTATEPVFASLDFGNRSYLMTGYDRSYSFTLNLTSKHNYSVTINDSTQNSVTYGPYFVTFDVQAPTIFGYGNKSMTDSSATLIFNTSEDTNFTLFYGNETGRYQNIKASGSNVRYHEADIEGLAANKTYYYIVYATDNAGNTNTSEEHYFRTQESDIYPPQFNITYPYNNSIINQSYRINLSIDQDEATSCIYLADEMSTIMENANFSIFYNGYKNLTVNCTDSNNNTMSKRIFFNINDTSSPIKSSFAASASKTSITFTFNTDEPSNATVLDSFEGYSLSHSITISGLNPGTSYDYEIKICDRLGNCNITVGSKATASSSSGGGGGSSGGGSISGYTRPVTQIKQDFSDSVFVSTDYKSNIIFLRIEKPQEVPAPIGKTYQYVEIIANESKEAKLSFKVNKTWIEMHVIQSISLLRYHKGSWEELPTVSGGTDSDYNYYNATTPGFSYFAIVGKPLEIKKNETSQLKAFGSEEDNSSLVQSQSPASKKTSSLLIFFVFLLAIILTSIYLIGVRGNKK